MLPKAKTVYFHVDVNSAFLSWTAIQHLANGETLDLRTVPAVVGGDEEKRHGVVLAKSIPAKRYGIQTGESLFMARSKYPNLIVAAPDFDWYVKNSKAMIRIFGDYTPDIEQYSIDEAFLNMTGSEGLFGPPLQAAQTIKDRIHRELGFTVNIGIAPNRLLAKMASDFEKPDKIHVLTQDMVPQKLWPLPVGNLFGVGPKSVKRMHEIGIYTIGDLANADADILRGVFGVRGQVFRDYANGIESEPMTRSEVKDNSYGNSVTTPQDLKRPVEADATMLALCESVAGRLRMDGKKALGRHALYLSREPAFRDAVNRALEGSHAELILDEPRCQLLADPVFEGEQVRGAALLLIALTDAQEAERLRREFTANVSHELKTPLTSISGYAELIENRLAQEKDIPLFAARIRQESGRLLALVQDILRLSQLDEGYTGQNRQRVYLLPLIQAQAARLEQALRDKGLQFCLEGTDEGVDGYPSLLEELFYNLLDNAIRYNREGGEVRVTLSKADGCVSAAVSDTGIGIAEEHQARVFERFYRVDKSHSKKTGGTGLGLAIVKHIAGLHGAQIQLDSTPGVGTTVRLLFPKA